MSCPFCGKNRTTQSCIDENVPKGILPACASGFRRDEKRPTMSKYFFCHYDQMWEDSWTYGDWKQYICNRGTETQCARGSRLPFFLMSMGLTFIATVLLAILFYGADGVRWDRAIPTLAIGILLVLPITYEFFTGRFLMVAVGPMNKGARRVCPWDEKP
jgi:hypothetical protein